MQDGRIHTRPSKQPRSFRRAPHVPTKADHCRTEGEGRGREGSRAHASPAIRLPQDNRGSMASALEKADLIAYMGGKHPKCPLDPNRWAKRIVNIVAGRGRGSRADAHSRSTTSPRRQARSAGRSSSLLVRRRAPKAGLLYCLTEFVLSRRI